MNVKLIGKHVKPFISTRLTVSVGSTFTPLVNSLLFGTLLSVRLIISMDSKPIGSCVVRVTPRWMAMTFILSSMTLMTS